MAEMLEGLQVGAQDYLFKPGSEIDRLTHTIHHAIETPQVMNNGKATKQMLLKSEPLLYQIMHANADGVLLVNQDGKVLYVNPAATVLLQRSSASGQPTDLPTRPICSGEHRESGILLDGLKERTYHRGYSDRCK